ncbi:maestro heat-like repeat family member 5 isoform X2 [Cervus elaphus]|uniref:maestro heat-like repeat family member 5 isoform X2 n=1 Tax=Cervus elaphus TaxID=9860 RepID=UPI001CC32C93|nr:maestro heat-like repeat family member 5 isoform X2 [Cervus elaphus]
MAPAGHCHRWAGTEGERRVAAGREQEGVRGGAIFLYGDVIYSGGKKFRQALKSHAFQALVPLLFHLADSCPEKAKLTFLRCAILLKWEFRKELFRKLAWGHGPGAENDIFIYMVESNFNSYHQFLMQALVYLDSPNRRLKLTAMKFIGRCGHCPIHVKPQSGALRSTGSASWAPAPCPCLPPSAAPPLPPAGGILQDYFSNLCFYLKKDDVKTLKKYFETLRQDPDSMSRRFCKHFSKDVAELSQYVMIF